MSLSPHVLFPVAVRAQASGFLPRRFVDSQFAFRKVMTGATELRPRWKRGVGFVDGALGEAIGQTYVAAHFPPASKAAMLALVANLKLAMKGRIERLDWMSPTTKQEALAKLARMRVFLGWAQGWRIKQREAAMRQQVASDPHSPARFRVDGPVRNIDAWYTAFAIKPGAPLYVAPTDRARIW